MAAQQKSDFKVRPPAGPGALSQRSDLQGTQPLRVPTDLPYGSAEALRSQEQAVPVPTTTQATPSTRPSLGGPQAPQAPPGGFDPAEALAAIGAHPTDFPNQPLVTGASQTPAQSLAFKIDALRYLASLPFAGPEVRTVLKQAQDEYNNAKNQQLLGSAAAQPPTGTPSAPAG